MPQAMNSVQQVNSRQKPSRANTLEEIYRVVILEFSSIMRISSRSVQKIQIIWQARYI